MKPRGKNVVLGLVIQEKQGTILVPKTHQKSTDHCEVRHIGPDVDVKTLKVGDIVLKPEVTILSDRCRQGQKYDVMDGDVPCMVVDESDIRLVLEDGAEEVGVEDIGSQLREPEVGWTSGTQQVESE